MEFGMSMICIDLQDQMTNDSRSAQGERRKPFVAYSSTLGYSHGVLGVSRRRFKIPNMHELLFKLSIRHAYD